MLSHKLRRYKEITGPRLSYITKTDVNNASITIPSTSQTGDLAVLFQLSVQTGSTAPAGTTPAGWTDIVNTSRDSTLQGASRAIWSYKILGSSDPNSSITGMSFDAANHKTIFIFRPAALTISSITSNVDIDYSDNTASVNPPSGTISASGRQAPLIVFGFVRSPTSGWTPTTLTNNSSPAFSATAYPGTVTTDSIHGYTIYNSSPSNVTIDMPATVSSQPRVIIQGFSLSAS